MDAFFNQADVLTEFQKCRFLLNNILSDPDLMHSKMKIDMGFQKDKYYQYK